MTDRLVRKMEDLLKGQADCLRAGDLVGALSFAPGIERILDKLEATSVQDRAVAPGLAGLKGQADQNSELISAAKRGVEAARSMLEQSESRGFNSYDASGRARQIGG